MIDSNFPEVDDIDKETAKIEQKITDLANRQSELSRKRRLLLKEEKILRDWIWKTKNPNIVALRKELLAMARLAYDENEEFEPEPKTIDGEFDEWVEIFRRQKHDQIDDLSDYYYYQDNPSKWDNNGC